MKTPDCHAFRHAVFEGGDLAPLLGERPDLAAHRDGCALCRAWLERFTRGLADAGRIADLAAGVAARTGGAPCARARELAGASFDEPLAPIERTLLAAHLDACEDCRAVVAEMNAAAAGLAELAETDPDPAFTTRVLAATSRRPAAARRAERWRAAWAALVRRPRFALEAAYALTLVLILIAGNPVSAWERTVAHVEPLAREHVVAGLDALGRALGTHLDAWRDRAALGPGVARQPAVGGSRWIERIRQTWDDALGAAGAWVSSLAAEVEALVRRIREWTADLFSDPTEPAATAARSRQ